MAAGQVLPLAVENERCECVLPTGQKDDKYYLIFGSVSRSAGPYRVLVQTAASSDPARLPLEVPWSNADWARHVQDLHQRVAKARRSRPPAEGYHPAAEPSRQRDFYLFTKENDFLNPTSYVTITGELRAFGRYCQVYVDRDQPDPVALQPTVDDIIRTFDDEVYPKAKQLLGHTLDVDRDGRFTILMTGWLGKLVNGKVALGGFVRGSDFYRDLAAPFGNRCDMMYLNTDLKPGPHLRTLLAHEYTHAVIFSEHVFGFYLPEMPKQDEEGWLNEGLAHIAEDLHGYSWSNLDYRISAFLSAPERYQLVVPDYYGAGLWRSHGHRGATFLFLRWCLDRFGADLTGRLIQTNLSGVANVEAATREHFAEMFRHWSAALLLSGMHGASESIVPLTHLDLRRPLEGRLLCGPRLHDVPLTEGREEITLNGTTAAYILLHSPGSERSRVVVSAEPGTELQVSLVRLPEKCARLSLRLESTEKLGDIRAIVTAHDAPVALTAAAWERLVPTANRPEDTSYRAGTPAAETVRDWFGESRLEVDAPRTGRALALPPTDDKNGWIFKVAGIDASGQPVAAWAAYAAQK